MEKNNNVIEIDVKGLFRTLLRWIWLVILVVIVSVVGAGYYTQNYIQPYYRSSAKLYILNQQSGSETTLTDLQMGMNLTPDYMILITSRPVMEKVINKLNLNMSYQELAGLISVYTPEGTRVLEITVTHDDPDMAKLLVDTIAEASTESMVSIMGIDKVSVVEEGSYPYGSAGPNVKRNMYMAGLAGGFIISSIISIIFLLNDDIKTGEDIEKYLGLTTLGIIPVEEGNKNKKKNKQKSKPKQRGKIAA